ncbi:cytoskeleton-associated protein 2-like [Odontesthes bonariensis]|uniref:cytoskeleton-associated protein 2-like n=1 Tax=Odontesthes bonariensis TaxID=219752 RepID=UPI003F58E934
MDDEPAPVLSRKEMRKQKLMEYLAAKGRLKPPSSKTYLHDNCQDTKPETSALKVLMGKENKGPAERLNYNVSKGQTLTSQSSQPSPRREFGITYKTNIKGRTLTGQQNSICPSSNRVPAQPKPNRNLVLPRTYSAVSSKSNLTAGSHLKKQPCTGIQSAKPPSNAARTVVAKSNLKSSLSSNSAASYLMKTTSTRLSIGPFVKTKTGLIPAVTQPRSTKSDRTDPPATARHTTTTTTTTVTAVNAKKAQSRSMPSTSISHRAVQRPVDKIQVQAQNKSKSNSKPQLGKHTQTGCRSQSSNGLTVASTSFRSKAEPSKSAGVPTKKSTCQPAVSYTKARSGAEGKKNVQPCKVAPQTSSAAASRCSSRAVSGSRQAAVTELGGKTKMSKQTHNKRENILANVPPSKAQTKPTVAPIMSRTVPQPSRTLSRTGWAADAKTPKVTVKLVPQTEGKKVTAAQEERQRKLQEWREAKGISYKRPPMPVKPPVRCTVSIPQPFWASMKVEDDAHSLICAVDRSLADCIKLLAEGCPPGQVKDVLSRLPAVSQKFAKYWICRARLMQQEGNLDVLPMFEEAVRVVLEPVDELRTVVFDILKKKDEIQASGDNEKDEGHIPTAENTPNCGNNSMMTPKPIRALINGEKRGSSVVKYKITSTPGGHPAQQREAVRVNGQEVRFFTPVRRSVRIERASLRYPASLQDHDVCVTSYNNLISEEDNDRGEEEKETCETSPSVDNTPLYVYRENEALKDKVFVQLICDDSA